VKSDKAMDIGGPATLGSHIEGEKRIQSLIKGRRKPHGVNQTGMASIRHTLEFCNNDEYEPSERQKKKFGGGFLAV